MKKLLFVLLALIIAISCNPVFSEVSASPSLEKDIVVLYTSDIHCGIDQGFGFAGLAAVRDELAKNNHVILVDNGDAIQGEAVGIMTKGEAIVDIMNDLNYIAAVPGNHEFDYGMERFLQLANETANYPYICCNFTYQDQFVFPPYLIHEIDGVKIAFVGVATPKTITSSTPVYFQDDDGNYIYDFCGGDDGSKLYAAVQTAVDGARAEGADYVILQAHLGIQAECAPWMSTDVIANTTGIDVVLDGHSHSELTEEQVANKNNEPVLLTACGTKLANIGYLRIGTNGSLSTGLYTWKNDLSFPALIPESKISVKIEEIESSFASQLDRVVGTSLVDLTISDPETGARLIRNAETNLGDLCADAIRFTFNTDIALINGGGIRDSLSKGTITYHDILRVHPFGNTLSVVEATGQQILDALEWNSRCIPGESGGFLHVSGLTYEIHTYIDSSCVNDDNGCFVGVEGDYRVKNVMVGNEPLVPDKTYTLAASSYMLKNNGDGNTSFMNCRILPSALLMDSEVLENYISNDLGGTVSEGYTDPYGEGRIIAVAEAPQ